MSYSINWFFMEFLNVPFNRKNLFKYGKEVISKKVGGAASEFVIMWESRVDPLFPTGTPSEGGLQYQGWHGKYSYHTFLLFDGHAEYRAFDTRAAYGTGWRITVDVP